MKIIQSSLFSRTVKKLYANEKKSLDRVIKRLIENPKVGDLKIGDLSDVRVYKYKVKEKQFLLGYKYDQGATMLTLIALGQHENFYRDIKKVLK